MFRFVGTRRPPKMRVSSRGVCYIHVSAYLLEKGAYTLRIRRTGSL